MSNITDLLLYVANWPAPRRLPWNRLLAALTDYRKVFPAWHDADRFTLELP